MSPDRGGLPLGDDGAEAAAHEDHSIHTLFAEIFAYNHPSGAANLPKANPSVTASLRQACEQLDAMPFG